MFHMLAVTCKDSGGVCSLKRLRYLCPKWLKCLKKKKKEKRKCYKLLQNKN